MTKKTMDGNAAAAYVSYAFSEIAVIYPITPSSPMAEQADIWANAQKTNLFQSVPIVKQMQSESGVAGAIHGALTCGALTTTYTCSQGLLLMLPDMYKIAGELLPTVFHVSARALATHALSIFGDHQDVMAARQTGFAFLCSSTVQESMDLALVAHLATLRTSIPFVHFFDGFRTSHEVQKIDCIDYDEMLSLLDFSDVSRFRERALTPDKPCARGTTQNPDVYFQNREAANGYYLAATSVVQEIMDKVARLTDRSYHLFDYFGDPLAKRVIVIMGSGASTVEETVEKLNENGEKVGVIKVRLYRPFDGVALCAAIPQTCKRIAVLDRTKESGAVGEPLYLDVCAALHENGRADVAVFGGRYGLGSKEFTPACVLAVFENLKSEIPKNRFTVGICDDVTHTSLEVQRDFCLVDEDCVACKFYGLGSDGTVGANKNSIKIIGDHTPFYVQGYFAYDSRKSGGVTLSHLRFSKKPIRSSYCIDRADFIACHNPSYPERYDMLSDLKDGGTFLLNCPALSITELDSYLPAPFKQKLAKKRARLYVIDATEIANSAGLSGRTGAIMQAAFFYLQPKLIPYSRALELLKAELKNSLGRKGEKVLQANFSALDRVESAIKEIAYPDEWKTTQTGAPVLARTSDKYFQDFMLPILSLRGDELPVSAFSPDGSVPTGTSKLEKHGLPYLLPNWIPENCIQCNQCSFVCPHACIRPFLSDESDNAPETFITLPATGVKDKRFRIQVSPHDCMGCGVCANVCPTKDKALVMRPAEELMPTQGELWEFAQSLPTANASVFKRETLKGSQFYPPLFEFSYACSGCGETPYLKVLTQLFGERLLIANATGCSSIYGASSPTCPYTVNAGGKGPAWSNSLFEDNAEFGYGMRLALNAQKRENQTVWIVGGDGWAYDIGYGGLDHVLASGENVNVLVLDSEVYSNTGGQRSKATPLGAIARFATGGKALPKKDLGLMAITYGYVYVAQVSMGANKQQLLNALTEAESYDGPSLIIAYSPCISHGVNLSRCMEEELLAVESGYWQLFRYHPKAEKRFTLDSKDATKDLYEFLKNENRFAALEKTDRQKAETFFAEAAKNAKAKRELYRKLSEIL